MTIEQMINKEDYRKNVLTGQVVTEKEFEDAIAREATTMFERFGVTEEFPHPNDWFDFLYENNRQYVECDKGGETL